MAKHMPVIGAKKEWWDTKFIFAYITVDNNTIFQGGLHQWRLVVIILSNIEFAQLFTILGISFFAKDIYQ